MICLCLPIGHFVLEGMGVSPVMYNLWIETGDGLRDFSSWPLFLMLVLSGTISLIDIFLYKNRPLQAKLCWVIMGLLAIWYLGYFLLGNSLADEFKADFQFSYIVTCLPAIAIILTFLARKGIMADEKLVRSMDRIR